MSESIAEKLRKPFDNIHYRPKTCYNGSVLLLAYLDSRDVVSRLDEVFGWNKWNCEYSEVKGNLFCRITILSEVYVYKEDCGVESNTEKEKGEASDSFKRAAVKFGIGAYLYSLPKIYVNVKQSGKNRIKIKDNATGKTLTGYYDDPVIKTPTKQKTSDEIRQLLEMQITKEFALVKDPTEKLLAWINGLKQHNSAELRAGLKRIMEINK